MVINSDEPKTIVQSSDWQSADTKMQCTIERLSIEALGQVEKKVGALIGTDLELSLLSASLIKKQGFLESQNGRNSIISLLMRGRYEGQGCLVAAEDCAVRLAGKMLMLPSLELNDIINAGSYSEEEELSYAFDEIAKCLVISFLDTFQRSSNFISTVTCQAQKFAENRKEMAEILSHLSADQTYYQVGTTITLAGVTTNVLSLLLPAFILVCSEPFRKQAGNSAVHSSPPSESQNRDPASISSSGPPEDSAGSDENPLFPHLRPPLQKELSDLLGSTVQLRQRGSFSGPLPELFRDMDTGPQLRTRISISGAVQNHGWLCTATRDALKIGLLLADTNDATIIPGSPTGASYFDCQDGYQEISSIFIDVVDLVCNDLSEGNLSMVKDAVTEEADLPSESVDRMDDNRQMYVRTSIELMADYLICGTMHILLPVELYENLKTDESPRSLEYGASHGLEPYEQTDPIDAPDATSLTDLSHHAAEVLLVEDSSAHAPEILDSLEKAGIKAEVVSLADDLSKADLDSYLAVLLVLERLDEIGLGVVIKIKSSSSVPLLVAASLWTETAVMKALRYGVDDIIMLPAESDELLHKLRGREPRSV